MYETISIVRELDELIDRHQDAWPMVLSWAERSIRLVEVLAAEAKEGERTLVAAQVTTGRRLGPSHSGAAGS